MMRWIERGFRRGLLALGLLSSACGGRAAVPPDASGGDTGETGDATLPDSFVPNTFMDGGPASDAAEPPPDYGECGAPWVLFTLGQSTGGDAKSAKTYARRSDGSGGHALPLPVPSVQNASVSPDGTELLYSDFAQSHLYLYRFADGTNTKLTTKGPVGHGAVSPDGREVAFTDGQNLWMVGTDADAGAEREILMQGAYMRAGYPVFTQDSASILFAANDVVERLDLSGGSPKTVLTQVGFTTPNPTLSPDYTQLAAIVECNSSALFSLRVYDYASLPATCASGKLVRKVPHATSFYAPSWGPTGEIAYAQDADIWLVSLDGTTHVLTKDLTGRTTFAWDPTWAPACTPIP